MTAEHRFGQTFITWAERADLVGERYRVYRSGSPITAESLASATLIAEVGKGSNRIWTDRYRHGGDDAQWRARYLERAVIRDGAAPLNAATGLLVWTPSQSEVDANAQAGAWYAVVVVGSDGAASAPLVSLPVTESVADPKPVLVQAAAGGDVRVYVQYMDLHHWNATFHAPHARNGRYGLAEETPGIDRALAYAYTYVVAGPDPANCPDPVPSRIPAYVTLHGWSGDSEAGDLSRSPYWCAYEVRPVDTSQTWWFGFAAGVDYRTGALPGAGDTVANFTEERVLRMVHDLLADEDLGQRVDPERVYLYGQSMGGSGTLAMALRYPKPFAAAYAGEPMTNYAASGDGGGTDWRTDIEWKWGTRVQNLGVELRAPGNWANHLQSATGTGVWTWQNHSQQVLDRRSHDVVPFGVAHGLLDDIIEWSTQGQPFYPRMALAGQAIGGQIVNTGHSWTGFAGLQPAFGMDNSLVPFHAMQAVLSETVPGIASDSIDPAWPPSGEVSWRLDVEWSSSWNPWDGAPVDEADRWRMSLRSRAGTSHTISVVPRRLQRFAPQAGQLFEYRVWGASAARPDAPLGTVIADADGLVTVPGIVLSAGGVRVEVRRQA